MKVDKNNVALHRMAARFSISSDNQDENYVAESKVVRLGTSGKTVFEPC